MAAAGISGTGLALATAGGVLMWAGLSGASPIEIVKTVAGGHAPPKISVGSPIALFERAIGSAFNNALGAVTNSTLGAGITSGLSAVVGGSYVTGGNSSLGNRIAAAATGYVGKVPYLWGGATPAGWDCSGFVTYVLHHDIGLNLPSNDHTVSQEFYVWSGLKTISASQAQAGDLVCWLTHVAIAISPTECVGAETPALGTTTGTFQNMGPGGETYLIRRLIQAAPEGTVTA